MIIIPNKSGNFENLNVTGNATFGDASGDITTINSGTVVAPNATNTNADRLANVGTLDARYNFGAVVLNSFGGVATAVSGGAVNARPNMLQVRANPGTGNRAGALIPGFFPEDTFPYQYPSSGITSLLFEFYLSGAAGGRITLQGNVTWAWTHGEANVNSFGVYIENGNLTLHTRAGGTHTNHTTISGAFPVSAGNYTNSLHRLEMRRNNSNGQVTWILNGTNQGTYSGPTGVLNGSNFGISSESFTGATAVTDIFLHRLTTKTS